MPPLFAGEFSVAVASVQSERMVLRCGSGALYISISKKRSCSSHWPSFPLKFIDHWPMSPTSFHSSSLCISLLFPVWINNTISCVCIGTQMELLLTSIKIKDEALKIVELNTKSWSYSDLVCLHTFIHQIFTSNNILVCCNSIMLNCEKKLANITTCYLNKC